jgi:hypothetical protein
VLLSRNLPIRTQSSNQKESASKYTRLHPTDLQTRLLYQLKFTDIQPVSIDTPVHCCERNNTACLHCYPPSIVYVTKETQVLYYSIVVALITLLNQGNLIHVTLCSKVHHQQQCIVDNNVQYIGRRSILLLMGQGHMQFQFQTSGLAVYVVLRCKQHSLEHLN